LKLIKLFIDTHKRQHAFIQILNIYINTNINYGLIKNLKLDNLCNILNMDICESYSNHIWIFGDSKFIAARIDNNQIQINYIDRECAIRNIYEFKERIDILY